MLSVKHQVPFFESLVWLNLWLNPGLLDHWWTLYLLGQMEQKNEKILRVIYADIKKDFNILIWVQYSHRL